MVYATPSLRSALQADGERCTTRGRTSYVNFRNKHIARTGTAIAVGAFAITGLTLPVKQDVSHAQTPACAPAFNAYAAGAAAAQACGLRVHPLQSKKTLADGGTQYTYTVDGGNTVTFRLPPATFDPLSATAAQLASYYLPQRPSSGAALGTWERLVNGKHKVPPAFLIQGSQPFSQPQPTGFSTATSPTWSVYYATGATFSSIEGYYT